MRVEKEKRGFIVLSTSKGYPGRYVYLILIYYVNKTNVLKSTLAKYTYEYIWVHIHNCKPPHPPWSAHIARMVTSI
jgi:hypothetical protein